MAQQGQGQSDGSMNNVWLFGGILVVLIFIWHHYQNVFIHAYLQLKYHELMFLEHFSFVLPDTIDEDILNMLEYLIDHPDSKDGGAIAYLAQQTGRYLAPFQLLIAAILFHKVWHKNAQLRYNKKYSMLSLAEQEKNNWLTITPVVGLNLIDQDVNTGPWAMALTPLQFAKKHELIKIETVADRKSPWKTEGVKKMILDQEKAYQVFLSQMGPLWSGEFDLPEHRRALFAIFLARIEHDAKGSQELINELAVSYAKGRPNFDLVKPLIQKHRQSKKAAECVQNHAYVYTVLASMLKLARLDGVLASADFIWLKPIDRELWYVLNTVGRQTPFSEIAGPFAHWKAELEMGRPLFRPIIEEAVAALQGALDKVVYTE